MRDIHILGVGMTRFEKSGRSAEDMGCEAICKAIDDAGVERKDVQAAYFGHTFQGMTAAQRVIYEAGLTGIPCFNHENACASGSAALYQGFIEVACGVRDLVVVVGVENMTKMITGLITVAEGENLMLDVGGTMPMPFAMLARIHMREFGTTLDQIAMVSVKNHRHGALNPLSQYQKEITLEEVHASRLVCDPLTLFHCCPIADGAAAVILASKEWLRGNGHKPVRMLTSVILSGAYRGRDEDLTGSPMSRAAAKEAYEAAGVGPEDLDVIELHDCFTIAELVHYESLGLCPIGEGGRLLDEGATELGGRIPINTSGGLLSKGHPLGATGVAQVVEITTQLRGEAGARQVEGAKVGLTHNMGGANFFIFDGAACGVNILGI